MPTPPARCVGLVPNVDYERAESKEELKTVEIAKKAENLQCQ